MRHDAPSYVERRADRELFDGLLRGEFCYVLTSRQMGKSSLMVRTANKLREQGVAVVVLDLTAIGQNVTPEQWYHGLIVRVGRQLELEDDLEKFWDAHPKLSPVQRFFSAIRDTVLQQRRNPLVMFVDEVDVVRTLNFTTDEFFAAIRECYNRRTEDKEFNRLTFCLLGVATPSDLIRNTRITPFNIAKRIELNDFTPEEAAPLGKGLPQPELLERILYWTSGHPYLTQRLCQSVAEDQISVDEACDELFFSSRARERDDNLIFVRERLLRSRVDRAGLLHLYEDVLRGKKVVDDEIDRTVDVLRLSGIVRANAGRLEQRNRIYARAFDENWVEANMPDAEVQRQRAAFWRGVLRTSLVAAVVVLAMALLGIHALNQTRLAEKHKKSAAEATKTAAEASKYALAAGDEARRAEQVAQQLMVNQADQLLLKSNFSLALHHLLEFAGTNNPATVRMSALLRRSNLLRRMNRFEEAWADFCQANEFQTTLPSKPLALAFSPQPPSTFQDEYGPMFSLVRGVRQITVSPGTPGPVFGNFEFWRPVVSGDDDSSFPSTFVLARHYEKGRIVALGHEWLFSNKTLPLLDNQRFVNNMVTWLAGPKGQQIGYTTGHGEWLGETAALVALVTSNGLTLRPLPAPISFSVLADCSALIVGVAWKDFTASEIEAVRQFVSNGGGLCLVGVGWSWEQTGKKLQDYPMNKLGEPFAVHWPTGYLGDPTHHTNASPVFRVVGPAVPSILAARAMSELTKIHEQYHTNLVGALETTPALRETFEFAVECLSLPRKGKFRGSDPLRAQIFKYYNWLTASWPRFYGRYNEIRAGAASDVRQRLWQAYHDEFISLPIAMTE